MGELSAARRSLPDLDRFRADRRTALSTERRPLRPAGTTEPF